MSDRRSNAMAESDAGEFRRRVRAYVRKRVASDADADDLTHNVLLKLLKSPPGPDRSLLPWMLTAARNVVIDHHRRRSRRRSLPLADVSSQPIEEEPEVADLAACIAPFLDRLSPADRELIERCDLNGESPSAIARRRGLPPSTVKARLSRARRKLRKQFEACCRIELDRRNTPIDCEPRSPATCPVFRL